MTGPELIGSQVPDWVREFLEAAGGQAESRDVTVAARGLGVHERTLRRAAVALEAQGVMKRTHHGVRRDKSVTWSLTAPAASRAVQARCPAPDDDVEPVVDPGPALCAICGHAQSLHSFRNLNCTACPGRACTKRGNA